MFITVQNKGETAPDVYPWEYWIAVSLFANPLIWMAVSHLPEAKRALLKKYMLWRKEKRAAFNASRIARFGSEPDGGTLSGLYTVGGKRLVLALREKDCVADSTAVPVLANGQWRTVFGNGSIDKDGTVKVDKAAWFAVFEEV